MKSILNAPLGRVWLFWLGQAGFVIKSKTGKLIGIDLYLSDCVEPVEGHVGYHRLMPHLLAPSDLTFDILIATHYHRDHFDIDAIPTMMQNGHTKLFCAFDCREDVDNLLIDKMRTTFVRPGDSYMVDGVKLTFVNSDHGAGAPQAVGVIVTVDNRRILEVADTCLHVEWKQEYMKEGNLDVLIAPINGAYGNLNEQENILLTQTLNPRLAIPCHFGMFASHGGDPGKWKELMETQLPHQCYKLFTMGEGIEI